MLIWTYKVSVNDASFICEFPSANNIFGEHFDGPLRNLTLTGGIGKNGMGSPNKEQMSVRSSCDSECAGID
jgi:hypothetical protein